MTLISVALTELGHSTIMDTTSGLADDHTRRPSYQSRVFRCEAALLSSRKGREHTIIAKLGFAKGHFPQLNWHPPYSRHGIGKRSFVETARLRIIGFIQASKRNATRAGLFPPLRQRECATLTSWNKKKEKGKLKACQELGIEEKARGTHLPAFLQSIPSTLPRRGRKKNTFCSSAVLSWWPIILYTQLFLKAQVRRHHVGSIPSSQERRDVARQRRCRSHC
jgi:hypothetical protein